MDDPAVYDADESYSAGDDAEISTFGAIWLHDLADVCRGAGLTVDEYPGWQTRSRSSGGYDKLLAIQVHHTASSTSPANDMAYQWKNSGDRPIGAIYLARDGRVTVGAAGATNTSGKGGPMSTPGGTIPLNDANRYVLSIEAANNGVGETWPDVQLDAYRRLVRALADRYGLPIARGAVHAHHEWTTRKIDPAGSSPYATGSSKWNMDAFRADVAALGTPPPPPTRPPTTTPIPGANDMIYPIDPYRNSDTRAFGGDGVAPGSYRFGLSPSVFPADVCAIALSVTAISREPGYVTVWPADRARPDTSVVNTRGGGLADNGAIVVGVNGLDGFEIYTHTVAHLICDVSAYWRA